MLRGKYFTDYLKDLATGIHNLKLASRTMTLKFVSKNNDFGDILNTAWFKITLDGFEPGIYMWPITNIVTPFFFGGQWITDVQSNQDEYKSGGGGSGLSFSIPLTMPGVLHVVDEITDIELLDSGLALIKKYTSPDMSISFQTHTHTTRTSGSGEVLEDFYTDDVFHSFP